MADSIAKEFDYTRIQMIKKEEYKPIKHNYLMTSRKCVGYEEKDDLGNLRNVTYYVVKDIDDFKEEFNPVN